ncbi:hypothetical protein [Leptospira weilii]|uniref:hypothetical protein n=1 Tax=Leptospira weilii TaxID=28184 RepID=UPI0007738F9E
MILENKRSVLQKYSGSQKSSQIGKSRLFRGRFQYSNFRNKFVIVFYSCVRVVRQISKKMQEFLTEYVSLRFIGFGRFQNAEKLLHLKTQQNALRIQ